jgi:hypothetical protein
MYYYYYDANGTLAELSLPEQQKVTIHTRITPFIEASEVCGGYALSSGYEDLLP